MPFSAHHVKGAYSAWFMSVRVDLDCSTGVVFARILHCQACLSPFSILSSLEGSPWGHSSRLEHCAPSFTGVIYPNFLGNLYGRFVSFPSFIHVFSHLFISLWTQGYLFYELYSTILLYLVTQIVVPTLTTEPLVLRALF